MNAWFSKACRRHEHSAASYSGQESSRMTKNYAKENPMRHHHHFHETIIAAIRTRAYEIWESEGRPDGHDLDHWLQAEAEVNPAEDEDGGKP
jgi:Protein of unknown function (DUF2934)